MGDADVNSTVAVGVAARLYALPPEDFTAARTAAARADKVHAATIKALRKPTVGAWLVNNLVRTSTALVEELLALGPALAAAQSTGAGDTLRELGEQRRGLVDAVTAQALASAGRPVPAPARAEVASTLEAALADPASADAVRTGRLVRALSYAGFGEVDLGGAVAAPAPLPARAGRQIAAARQVAAAEEVSQAAAGRLDDAVRAAQQADREHEGAAAAAADAEQTVRGARRQRDDAAAAERAAAARAEQAVRDVAAAQDAAERARAALDGLRRG